MSFSNLDYKKIFFTIKKILLTYITLVFVLLALAAFLYLGVVFYFYAWQVTPSLSQLNLKKISLNQGVFERVMENFSQRQTNFDQEAAKTYINPFR